VGVKTGQLFEELHILEERSQPGDLYLMGREAEVEGSVERRDRKVAG